MYTKMVVVPRGRGKSKMGFRTSVKLAATVTSTRLSHLWGHLGLEPIGPDSWSSHQAWVSSADASVEEASWSRPALCRAGLLQVLCPVL